MSEKPSKAGPSESKEKEKSRVSRFLSFIWNAMKWMFGKNEK